MTYIPNVVTNLGSGTIAERPPPTPANINGIYYNLTDKTIDRNTTGSAWEVIGSLVNPLPSGGVNGSVLTFGASAATWSKFPATSAIPLKAGKWYGGPSLGITGSISGTIGAARSHPLPFEVSGVIDNVGIWIGGTAGGAGATLRFFGYTDSQGEPADLIFDTGTISVAGLTNQFVKLATAINVSTPTGRWHVGVNPQGGTAPFAELINSNADGTVRQAIPMIGIDEPTALGGGGGGTYASGHVHNTVTTGAMPATANVVNVSGGPARVMIRGAGGSGGGPVGPPSQFTSGALEP